jgi:general secretion pathway protein K
MKGYFEKSPQTPLYKRGGSIPGFCQRGGSILELFQSSGGFQAGEKISHFGKGGLSGILCSKGSPLKCVHNQHGVALVVVLLALVLLTAMVVEFSYGVYTGTNDLYNWRDSQRLSVMAKSGINVSAKGLRELLKNPDTWPKEMPVENPFEDFKGTVVIRIEDETGKFNLNSIVPFNQDIHENDPGSPYNRFKKLLTVLSIDVKIEDRIVDWIKNGKARLSSSGTDSKNFYLDSVDEILLINGISREDYDKLLPYVTVYGSIELPLININSAQKPVLMSLYDSEIGFSIDENKAKSIIQYRNGNPFGDISEFKKIAGTGFAANQITVNPEFLTIRATASSEGVKRVIETVLDKTNIIHSWKEY